MKCVGIKIYELGTWVRTFLPRRYISWNSFFTLSFQPRTSLSACSRHGLAIGQLNTAHSPHQRQLAEWAGVTTFPDVVWHCRARCKSKGDRETWAKNISLLYLIMCLVQRDCCGFKRIMVLLGNVVTGLVSYNCRGLSSLPTQTLTERSRVSLEHLLPAFSCIPSLQIGFLPCLPFSIHSSRVLHTPPPIPPPLPLLSSLSLYLSFAFMPRPFSFHTSLLLSHGVMFCSCQRAVSGQVSAGSRVQVSSELLQILLILSPMCMLLHLL